MPSIPLAAHFLAGSILTLVVPVALLIVITLWHVRAIARVTAEDEAKLAPPPSQPALPREPAGGER